MFEMLFFTIALIVYVSFKASGKDKNLEGPKGYEA